MVVEGCVSGALPSQPARPDLGRPPLLGAVRQSRVSIRRTGRECQGESGTHQCQHSCTPVFAQRVASTRKSPGCGHIHGAHAPEAYRLSKRVGSDGVEWMNLLQPCGHQRRPRCSFGLVASGAPAGQAPAGHLPIDHRTEGSGAVRNSSSTRRMVCVPHSRPGGKAWPRPPALW